MLVCGRYIIWLKQFRPWEIPAVVNSIEVVGVLICCALLLSVQDLKDVQLNGKSKLIWELMLYEFELGHNAVEVALWPSSDSEFKPVILCLKNWLWVISCPSGGVGKYDNAVEPAKNIYCTKKWRCSNQRVQERSTLVFCVFQGNFHNLL